MKVVAISVLSAIAFSLGCVSTPQVERIRIADTQMEIAMEKTHAHAFLAEYDFTLHLLDRGRRVASANMTGDSGGLARIDIFRVDSDTLAFKDHARALCVELTTRKIESCGLECVEDQSSFKHCDWDVGGVRVGSFDFDEDRNWRFIGVEPGNNKHRR